MSKIDRQRLTNFANEQANVQKFQILEFLNIEGSNIQLGENNLSGNAQDNGVSVQSPDFDFLLDLDGQPIQVKPGEVYAPIGYMKDGTTKIGDKAVIAGETFEVVGFLRDSQMNSPLSSSKRFLIHKQDFEKLVPLGAMEYLIEFKLKDLSKINEFETAYAAAGLEMNGPTGTKALVKIINGLSEGIMIAIILLVGILIVIIAFMCIRFTLLTKIEEDYREIGVMKAIGLRVKDIKKLYIAKYLIISLIGSVLGLALSFLVSEPLLANIRLYMGESDNSSWSIAAALLGSFIVFLLVIGYTQFLLRGFKHVSAAEAIRNGSPAVFSPKRSFFLLSRNKWLPINLFLGIKDVFTRKKLYFTMFFVLLLSSFIMIVPLNIHHTIASPEFVKTVGMIRAPSCRASAIQSVAYPVYVPISSTLRGAIIRQNIFNKRP